MARSMARSAEAQTNSFRTGGCPGTSQMRVHYAGSMPTLEGT